MTIISNNDIAQAIYLSSKDKTGHELSLFLVRVVKFLDRKRFLGRANDVLFRLKKIINREHGIIEAKISSVTKLHEETKKDIIHTLKKRYEAREIILLESLDERLLGGIKIEANDEIIDASLKNKINKLQEYLIRKV
ncbi:F0F1 ATP synthase subunit delta [Patescibacteria group bacterium]|nr:F0F1 ATP synthase subunit delta [Patescibacteria group bacterium]